MPNPFPFAATPVVNLTEVITSETSAPGARTKANDAWALAFDGIQNVAAQFQLALITYLGAGRFVGTDETVGQPTTGTGLTLRQPNATLLVNGRVYVIANPEPSPYQVITGILANKADGVEVFVSISPTTGQLVTAPEWQLDALPATDEERALVAGLLHLGRAETSATAVTDFTPSTIDGLGIIRPRGVASDGGEGGGSDPYAGLLIYLPDDLRPLYLVILDLQNQITDLRGTIENSDLNFPTRVDHLADEISINRLSNAEVSPHSIERGQISVVGAGFGLGQDDTPNYSPTTGDPNELPHDDGVFG